jgi:hypothetical protein
MVQGLGLTNESRNSSYPQCQCGEWAHAPRPVLIPEMSLLNYLLY